MNLTGENKNTIALTSELKGPQPTWDQATGSWQDAKGTWDVPGLNLATESKNVISLSAEAKN